MSISLFNHVKGVSYLRRNSSFLARNPHVNPWPYLYRTHSLRRAMLSQFWIFAFAIPSSLLEKSWFFVEINFQMSVFLSFEGLFSLQMELIVISCLLWHFVRDLSCSICCTVLYVVAYMSVVVAFLGTVSFYRVKSSSFIPSTGHSNK